MFGFVSKKKFEEYSNRIIDFNALVISKQSDYIECIMKLKDRIAKLEAANNCRDGKHVWVCSEIIPNIQLTSKISCKHCGVNKPVEKNIKELALAHLEKHKPKRKKVKK